MSFQPGTASRVVILGRTGSGKTVLSKTLQECYPRVVIVDKVHDYNSNDGDVFTDFQKFSRYLLKNQNSPDFRAIFQFDIHERNYCEVSEEIFSLCYDLSNCLVNIDECQFFSNSHYLQQLILVGRRRRIATITSTQRPANISKDIISQASDIFVGTMFETNDLKYLKDILPDHDLDKLSSLTRGQFLHYRAGQPSVIVSNLSA